MSSSPDRQREILLIRLKSIGDIVFTLPAVSQVRAAYPDARLRFLVSANLAPLLMGFRDINDAIQLDRDRFRKGNFKTRISEGLSLIRRLRQPRFSLTIDFQGYGETALLSWLSRAGERWGTVYARGRKWAYTRAVPRDSKVHPAEAHLGFLRACGLPSSLVRNEFALPASYEEEARAFLTAKGFRLDKPILLFQPFTSSPEKEWPVDHYLAIAQQWQEREWQVLFSGGPGDRAKLQPVSQRGFAVSAGVPLLVTAGLMKLAELVVGGDTGLLHLAAAMGKRVVMLMGSAGPGSCHPFGHPEWAVVPPTGKPVAAVLPETVNQAFEAALAERRLMTGSNRR